MIIDSACRVLLFDVAKKHGLQDLEVEETTNMVQSYLKNEDYILFKQKDSNCQHRSKADKELTMKH